MRIRPLLVAVALLALGGTAMAGTVPPLDSSDPWSGFQLLKPDLNDPWDGPGMIHVSRRLPPPDTTDPWADADGVSRDPRVGSKDEPRLPPSERMMRNAVKAAVDAGDLERAAELLRILRASKR